MNKGITLKKAHILDQFALIGWCVIYIISVNKILSEYYLAGVVEVVSYHKCFSLSKALLCFILVEGCYYLTLIFKSDNRLLENVKKLLFVIFTIPMIFSYALFKQKYSFEFMIYGFFYWVFFCFYCKYWRVKIKTAGIAWANNKIIERWFMVLLTGGLLFFMVRSLGSFKLSISLTDIYTTRTEFKESGNFVLTVFKSALGLYILPWLIVKFMSEKRYAMGIVFAFAEIVVFSMAKDKIYLLLLVFSLSISLIGKPFFENGYNWLRIALLFLSGINILALFHVAQNMIFNIFTRRFFVMPTWLQYVNYEYFYDKTKLWWRQDTFLIDKLFTPVYPRSAIEMIASDYFNGWITNPNCGMTGEAFTRCGYFGVIIYPLLLVIVIRIISYFFRNSNERMLFIFSFALSTSIANDTISSTSFVATMLVILFFAFFANKKKNERAGHALEL